MERNQKNQTEHIEGAIEIAKWCGHNVYVTNRNAINHDTIYVVDKEKPSDILRITSFGYHKTFVKRVFKKCHLRSENDIDVALYPFPISSKKEINVPLCMEFNETKYTNIDELMNDRGIELYQI
jgi:hypothetical protein